MRVREYEIPEELQYDQYNFWVRRDGEQVRIGLSDYGQSTIGDVLYLEIGAEGMELQQGKKFGSIEAGKWVGRLQAPLSGTIVRVNQDLESCPSALNSDPYGRGWLYEIIIYDSQELAKMLDAQQYAAWVGKQILLEEEQEVPL